MLSLVIVVQELFVFSSAVFEENVEVLSSRCRHRRLRLRRRAKILSFSNIAVYTEDISLKLRLVVYYQKESPYQ